MKRKAVTAIPADRSSPIAACTAWSPSLSAAQRTRPWRSRYRRITVGSGRRWRNWARSERGRALFHTRLVRRELVDRRAELAGHHHLVVLDHFRTVLGRKVFQHRRDRIARAGALRAERQRREDADAA